MLRHELYKIFVNKATVFFVAVILLVNAFQLSYLENNKNSYSVASYNAMWEALYEREESGETWSEILTGLQKEFDAMSQVYVTGDEYVAAYTGNIRAERELFERVQAELAFSLGYKEYLENIEATKNRFQSFGGLIKKDTYVYRSLINNAKAYENIEVTTLVPEASAGVELASHSDVTDFLALILFLYFGITVWIKEKEQGGLLLIRTSKNGRIRLAGIKLLSLVLACTAGGICLYMSNLLVALRLYGLGSLSRPLASVYMYGTTLFNITVGEFLLLNILIKLAAYIWIVFLISVICCKAVNSTFAFASILALSGISCLLYYNIPNLSAFVALKYLNPFAIIKTEFLFGGYKGLNFFGYPVDYRLCMFIVLLLGLIVFCGLTLSFFVQHVIKSAGVRLRPADRILTVWIKVRRRMEMHTGIVRHELYRIFICYKIIYVVFAALLLQVYINQPYTVRYYSFKEYYTRQYLEELAGPVTEEKLDYIESEKERLKRPKDETERERRDAVYNIVSRVTYLQQNKGADFVYDEPLNMLTASENNRKDLLSAVLVMVLLVLCMPCFFAPDLQSGMNRIIAVTKYGKTRLVRGRYSIGIFLALFLSVLVYIPPFLQIMKSYGVDAEVFSYSVNSLLHLSKYGTDMSIGMYFVVVFILRITAVILATTFIYKISDVLKSHMYTMFAAFAILLIPTVMVLINNRLLYAFYPYALFGGNLFMQSTSAAAVSTVGVILYLLAVLFNKRVVRVN